MNVFAQPVRRSTVFFTYLFGGLQLILCPYVNAQTFAVWGQIDANNLALSNVRVVASRSGQEAVTDEVGKFTLAVFSQDTLKLLHPSYPTRFYVLPALNGPINFYFDVAINKGDWRPYKDEHRATIDPPTSLPPPIAGVEPPTLPSFPWPIPPPSAKAPLDTRFFASDTTLAQVDRRLASALRKSGYPDPSYYQIPHGFALVSQVEQIERNGSPKQPPARWSSRVDSRFSQFALSNYLQHLYRAATGYFRVIVFLVTDVSTEKSQEPVGSREAGEWYSRGGDFLPDGIGRQRFTSAYRVTAQIYEFEKPENSKARPLNPGNCSGQDHLSKSKIMNYLTR